MTATVNELRHLLREQEMAVEQTRRRIADELRAENDAPALERLRTATYTVQVTFDGVELQPRWPITRVADEVPASVHGALVGGELRAYLNGPQVLLQGGELSGGDLASVRRYVAGLRAALPRATFALDLSRAREEIKELREEVNKTEQILDALEEDEDAHAQRAHWFALTLERYEPDGTLLQTATVLAPQYEVRADGLVTLTPEGAQIDVLAHHTGEGWRATPVLDAQERVYARLSARSVPAPQRPERFGG